MTEVTCKYCECFSTIKDELVCLNYHLGTQDKFLRVTADYSCIEDLKLKAAEREPINKGVAEQYRAKIRLIKSLLNYYKD